MRRTNAVDGPANSAFQRRFMATRQAVWGALPAWLRHVVPVTAVGFAMLNLITFALDLIVLSVLYLGLGVPYSLSVTIGYLVAFTAAFFLNKHSNFRSEGNLERQLPKYVGVVATNYLAFILALTAVLHKDLHINYLVSRVMAGLCEAVFMYCSMRWFVFAERPRDKFRRGRTVL